MKPQPKTILPPHLIKMLANLRFNPPTGTPPEHLALINNGEQNVLQQRGGLGLNTPLGVKSFTDPSQSQGNTLGSKATRTTSQSRSGQSNSTSSNNNNPTGGMGSNYNSNSGYGSGSSAMQGGFGAQAFGHSNASLNAITNAVLSGLSGGLQGNYRPNNSNADTSMSNLGNGWSVGSGVFANGKMQDRISQSISPTMRSKLYQDRIPPQAGQTMTASMVPPVPNGTPPQSNLASLAQSYQNYQQPPNAAASQMIANNMSRQAGYSGQQFGSAAQGGLGMQAFGHSSLPGDAVSAGTLDSGFTGGGFNGGAYPVGYNPNGPETPANGIDAMAGNTTSAPLTKLPSYGLGTGRNDQIAYGAGQALGKVPAPLAQIASKLFKGPLANSNADMGLLGQASNNTSPAIWGGGHSDNKAMQTADGIQMQIDPETGQQFYIDRTTGKKVFPNINSQASSKTTNGYDPTQAQPWVYPKYTQGWANLPTGNG